jgi:DNA polymerase III subunit delta
VKLPPARLSAFLRAPDASCPAVLCFGPDSGLVRERADRLTVAVCGDLKDPFRIAELSTGVLLADRARLADEIGAMSLTGGRRVIRIRGAEESLTPLLAEAIAERRGDSLVVVEGGDLGTRSGLRKLFETAKTAVAIPCYADSARDLAEVLRETLSAHKIAVAPDALAYLVAHLGGDRLMTRSELEKLALYVGDGGRVGLAEAAACIGDSSLLTLEDVVFAAADGDAAKLETAMVRLLQEDVSPVTMIRAVMRHFQRLHLTGARMEAGGISAEEAMAALRPQVFYKYEDRFRAQLSRWPPRRAALALDALTEAELRMKRGILPEETIGHAALLSLLRAASAKTA